MVTTSKQRASEPQKSETRPLATDINAKSGAKVVVGCKMPNGMVLHIDEKVMVQQQTPTGPMPIEMWQRSRKHPEVRVNGNATRFGEAPTWEITGKYGITLNVDRDFWVEWLEQNKEQSYVTQGVIFAEDTLDAARTKAKEQRLILSGLEPLNTATRIKPGTANQTEHVDPRWPRRIGNQVGSVSEVEQGERA